MLRDYRAMHPAEDLEPLRAFLQATADGQLFDRKNFTGHITASALVVDGAHERLLLLKHRYLQIFLPPGGHVDEHDESVIAAALRETQEEAGITPAALKRLPELNGRLPFDINSHPIPANPAKNEPAHVHHDLRYLFVFTGNHPIVPDPGETQGAQWFPIDAPAGESFSLLQGKLAEKLQRLS